MRYFEMTIVDVNGDGSLYRVKHQDEGLGIIGEKSDGTKCICEVKDEETSLIAMLTNDVDSTEILEVNLPEVIKMRYV